MVRTGQPQAQQAFNNETTQQQTAFNQGQQAIQQTSGNITKLDSGKQVAANPWMNPNYLASVNRATAGSLDASNDAGATALRMNNRRTGGMNNTSTTGAISDLAQQKMRLSDQLNAERQGQDWNKNVQYQAQATTAPLAIAGAEAPYYGGSTSGISSSVGDLTKFGLGQEEIEAAGLQAAGGAASAAICPAEGSLYLMADGSERLVERLQVGEEIAGIDDEPQTIEEIQSAMAPIILVRTENGLVTRNSLTHAFALPKGGFAVAARALGKIISTRYGPSKVVSVEPFGKALVFNVITNGSHTYRADGVWSLGVGDAERHVSMKEWQEIGKRIFKDRTTWDRINWEASKDVVVEVGHAR